MGERYTFDDSKIVYEILNNEVVLVNLDSGHYYMMQGSAAALWQLLSSGATAEEAAAHLAQLYQGDEGQIQQAVTDFLNELRGEDLLIPADGMPASAPAAELDQDTAGQPFEMPSMYKYTDMANLIQMDPIRDFDETGWPKRRSFPPAARK